MPYTYIANAAGNYQNTKKIFIGNTSSQWQQVRAAYVANASGSWTKVFPPAATYSVSSSPTTTNEGTSVTFALASTYKFDGDLVPYTISGVSSADIGGAALTGNFTITDNASTKTFNITADVTTEGTEVMLVAVSGASAAVNILDTSQAPTYSVTSSAGSVNEGATVTFTLTTTGVSNGTGVPYTISGVSSADIGGAALTGNFVIGGGTASVSFNVTADSSTEGNETMTLTVMGAARSVTVNDTSLTFAPAGTHGYVEFSAAGAVNWTIPSGTTQIRIIAIGGGGGGGGAYNGSTGTGTGTVGGGGGAGGVLDTTFNITPGNVVSMNIASGGAGGAPWTDVNTMAPSGGNTTVSVLSNNWTCSGGQGGNSCWYGGVGGTGPSASGGAGGDGLSGNVGGNGGNSYYTTGLGGGNTFGGGSRYTGGAGSLGAGGGGGGGSHDDGDRNAGGRGGNGYIRIYY